MNIFGLAKANSQAKSEKSATQEKPQVNQIEIAQNSNPQTEVNPSKSVFDLDTYRKNGCTDDDKNKEGAKAIRKDIMDFYGIDSDDTNLEEKLTRIYLDIMEDNKNDVLSKNCEDENITYDGDNEEEFNENVELMMAHMSHDGTNKGDDVHLSEVDFSDIEYSSETKTGSIEEKPVENGAEYIVYDSEGNVVKCISHTTDENGMTTIATYADSDKTQLISSESAFVSSKSDDEVKFKFGSGDKNTVNFKDDGNSVSVEVSRGALRDNYTVEKNTDGTYSLNGKQYFTLEEVAIDLNNKEIESKEEFDGVLNGTQQGKVGDCGFLSALNSLNSTEFGRQAIKDALSVDSDGNMTVNFAGIGMQYTISPKELKNATKYSKGDLESKVFELAWDKMLKDVKNGTLESTTRNWRNYFHESQSSLKEKAKKGFNTIAATFSASVYEILTGKEAYCYSTSNKNMLGCLDSLEQERNQAITVGNVPDEVRNGTYSATESVTTSKQYKDAFGNDITIYDMHSYAVKESDTKADGTRIVTIINPHDSSQEIVLDEETFLNAFNQYDTVDFSHDVPEPAYRQKA